MLVEGRAVGHFVFRDIRQTIYLFHKNKDHTESLYWYYRSVKRERRRICPLIGGDRAAADRRRGDLPPGLLPLPFGPASSPRQNAQSDDVVIVDRPSTRLVGERASAGPRRELRSLSPSESRPCRSGRRSCHWQERSALCARINGPSLFGMGNRPSDAAAQTRSAATGSLE